MIYEEEPENFKVMYANPRTRDYCRTGGDTPWPATATHEPDDRGPRLHNRFDLVAGTECQDIRLARERAWWQSLTWVPTIGARAGEVEGLRV